MSISAEHYRSQLQIKKSKRADLLDIFADKASVEEIFTDYGFEEFKEKAKPIVNQNTVAKGDAAELPKNHIAHG